VTLRTRRGSSIGMAAETDDASTRLQLVTGLANQIDTTFDLCWAARTELIRAVEFESSGRRTTRRARCEW
jgi:hypothetical protein